MAKRRNRLHYGVFIGLVIVLGLVSRSELASCWPAFAATYAGDTLWALMVFLGLGFVFPKWHIIAIASLTMTVAFGVEVSQLYSGDWIDSFRDRFIGAVTIGSGFLWSDLVCYTVGCSIGVLGELMVRNLSHDQIGNT